MEEADNAETQDVDEDMEETGEAEAEVVEFCCKVAEREVLCWVGISCTCEKVGR